MAILDTRSRRLRPAQRLQQTPSRADPLAEDAAITWLADAGPLSQAADPSIRLAYSNGLFRVKTFQKPSILNIATLSVEGHVEPSLARNHREQERQRLLRKGTRILVHEIIRDLPKKITREIQERRELRWADKSQFHQRLSDLRQQGRCPTVADICRIILPVCPEEANHRTIIGGMSRAVIDSTADLLLLNSFVRHSGITRESNLFEIQGGVLPKRTIRNILSAATYGLITRSNEKEQLRDANFAILNRAQSTEEIARMIFDFDKISLVQPVVIALDDCLREIERQAGHFYTTKNQGAGTVLAASISGSVLFSEEKKLLLFSVGEIGTSAIRDRRRIWSFSPQRQFAKIGLGNAVGFCGLAQDVQFALFDVPNLPGTTFAWCDSKGEDCLELAAENLLG